MTKLTAMQEGDVTFQVDSGMATLFSFLLSQDRQFFLDMMMAVQSYADRMKERALSKDKYSKTQIDKLDRSYQLMLLGDLVDHFGCVEEREDKC